MEMYVDKMPKDCWHCPCFRDNIDFPCGLGDGVKDYYLDEIDGGECPLKSIAEHDKQVRKEVCEEIRKTIFEYLGASSMEELDKLSLFASTLTYDVVTDKLDEIEGETNG